MTKTLVALCFFLFVCGIASAGTVYKWTEEGRVIYSQTPPPPGVEFEIVIEKDIGKNTAVAKASSEPTFEERREERLQKEKDKQVLEESNRIKEENCEIAKNNMQSLNSRGQVTIKEGDVYRKLSEEERQAKIEETKSLVEEFCQG